MRALIEPLRNSPSNQLFFELSFVLSLRWCLDGLAAVSLNKFDHLRDGLRGENREEVRYQEELVRFSAYGLLGHELAQSDALTVIGTSASAVDKGRVEPMHIEVLIVNEETFADRRVAVIQSVHVEPINCATVREGKASEGSV